jgi:hypothetical protein
MLILIEGLVKPNDIFGWLHLASAFSMEPDIWSHASPSLICTTSRLISKQTRCSKGSESCFLSKFTNVNNSFAAEEMGKRETEF